MYRLDTYSGGLIVKGPLYMNKPVLYSSCLCRLIILISFSFWSVVELYLERQILQLFCADNLTSF